MRNKLKIYTSLVVSIMILSSTVLRAQNDADHYTKINSKITIGFQTNKSVIVTLYRSNKSKALKTTPSLFIRIPVYNHIQFETGLTANRISNKFPAGTNPINSIGRTSSYDLSIPASLQYHFLPKSRVRPYVGAGVFYNFNPSLNIDKNIELANPHMQEPGLQYINIFFTQGVIFEINTKIQVSESFHFIPGAQKTLGISLGVGFTLP